MASRESRRVTAALKRSMNALRNQLALFSQRVAGNVGLRTIDLDCLDVILREGPVGPTALARRTGLHPATVTGILDRLQRDGWIARERGAGADRRAVTVRALPDRNRELFGELAGMNAAMDELCAGYSPDELELIAGFLQRCTQAGRVATDALAERPPALQRPSARERATPARDTPS